MRERHERELAKVRFEREMLEEKVRLEQLQDGEGRRRQEEEKRAEHKEWVEDQKRQLVEARVQRELGRYGEAVLPPSSTLPTSVLPGVPYEAHAGFVIFWDFGSGVPRQVSQCTLVYAFYDGAKPVQGIKSLPASDCEPEPGGLARALFSLRRQFMHIEPTPGLQLVVELQQVLAPPDAPGKPPKTTSLGWSSLNLFTAQRALNAG